MGDYVFICYARKDQEFVFQLATELKARGVPVWLDQWDIRAGANWNKSIDEAIGNCAAFLVVLSPAAVDSKEVQGEWLTALDEHKRLIVPVLCQVCRIPRQLRVFQYVDFTARRPDDEATLNQVVRVLQVSGVVLPESQSKSSTELSAASFSWRTALLALGVLGLVLVAVLYVSVQRRQKEEKRLAAEVLQAEEARQKAAEQKRTEEVARRQAAMVRVQAGEFWMGCNESSVDRDCDFNAGPKKKVFLDTFAIDPYKVTLAEYRRCWEAGKCSDHNLRTDGLCNWNEMGRENDPINCVNWDQAVAYCQWVGARLPTEAEWEKAARAGSDTRYSFGNDPSQLGEYTWHRKNLALDHRNPRRATRPVGELKPNAWGLYDMPGIVLEWVHDWYAGNYYKWGPDRNPQGPDNADGSGKVLRGSDWLDDYPGAFRADARRSEVGSLGRVPSLIIGFRCARSVE